MQPGSDEFDGGASPRHDRYLWLGSLVSRRTAMGGSPFTAPALCQQRVSNLQQRENLPRLRNQPADTPNPEFQHWGAHGGFGIPMPPEKLIPTTPFGNHPLMDWGVWPLDNDDTTKSDWEVASRAIEMLENMPDGKRSFLPLASFFLMCPVSPPRSGLTCIQMMRRCSHQCRR